MLSTTRNKDDGVVLDSCRFVALPKASHTPMVAVFFYSIPTLSIPVWDSIETVNFNPRTRITAVHLTMVALVICRFISVCKSMSISLARILNKIRNRNLPRHRKTRAILLVFGEPPCASFLVQFNVLYRV